MSIFSVVNCVDSSLIFGFAETQMIPTKYQSPVFLDNIDIRLKKHTTCIVNAA